MIEGEGGAEAPLVLELMFVVDLERHVIVADLAKDADEVAVALHLKFAAGFHLEGFAVFVCNLPGVCEHGIGSFVVRG